MAATTLDALSLREFPQAGPREHAEDARREFLRRLAGNGYARLVDVPDGFDHARWLAPLGEFCPGPSGKEIDDIVAEPGMDDVYYGSNRRGLLPHTEGYEFDGLPPRYLALWCVTPAAGAGGETTVFDTRPVLERAPAAELEHLRRTRFAYRSSDGLWRRGLGQRNTHPMLETVGGETLLRFSLNNISLPEPDPVAEAFMERVGRAWDLGHTAVTYERGDLLVFDNWRCLHSRNAYADPGRHLRRVQIGYRPGGG